jgi:hypothetical protein
VRGPWWLLLALLLACGLRSGEVDWERTVADLNESAVAMFVQERSERGLPAVPLEYRAGGLYSTDALPGAEGRQVWQVREARADVIKLPLNAQDRLDRVEFKADVLVRYEERYCRLAADPGAPLECQSWQESTCCNRIWKRSRGAWVAERPR